MRKKPFASRQAYPQTATAGFKRVKKLKNNKKTKNYGKSQVI